MPKSAISPTGCLRSVCARRADTDPEAILLRARASENREPTIDPDTDNRYRYFEHVLQRLVGDSLNAFDWHFHGGDTGNYRELERAIPVLRRLLNKCGYANVLLWITEMATYSGTLDDWRSPGRQPDLNTWQSEDIQVINLVKRFVVALSLGVQKAFRFALHEDYTFDGADSLLRHTGRVYDGRGYDDRGAGVKEKAYYACDVLTAKLHGVSWCSAVELELREQGGPPFRLTKQASRIYVVWWYNHERAPADGRAKTRGNQYSRD